MRDIEVNPEKAAAIQLTDRQVECATWVAAGKTDSEIGMIVGITQRTAKHDVLGCMAITDTHTRAQMVATLFIAGVFQTKGVAAALLLAFSFAACFSGADDMARRVRGRRARELATIEEAADLPEYLENDRQATGYPAYEVTV